MRLLAFYNDEHTWLASERLVIPADDAESLERSIDLAESLSRRLADRERVDQAAREEGLAAGREEGRAQALAEGQARTTEALLALNDQQMAARRELRESAATLALEIVRCIARDVAPADWLAAQAHAAAENLIGDGAAGLRVSSACATAVQERLAATPSGGLRVYADESFSDNDCRLETAAGHIDIDLETQLGRLADTLNNASTETRST